MVTSFALLVRRPGLTEQEFRSHWRDVHAPLVGHIDYLRGYAQHRADRDVLDAAARPSSFDGIAEFWWDDRSSAVRPHTDPLYTGYAQQDEPRFLDVTRLISLQSVPVFLLESAPPRGEREAASLLLLARPIATNARDFAVGCERAWRRAVADAPGAVDECILHLVDHSGVGDPSPVDAIVMCRWGDALARSAWHRSVLVDDGRDESRSRLFTSDEHVVLSRPRRVREPRERRRQ
jgi:hypothetical protein